MGTEALHFNRNLNKITVDELSTELYDLITKNLNHPNDTDIHVTKEDKNNWNNKISRDDENALASITHSGLMSAADKKKLDSLQNFTLNIATTDKIGGVVSGGDVLITESGLIQVVDGSHHNHDVVPAAETLAIPRTITLTDGVKSTAATFDGSQDVTIQVKEIDPSYIGSGYTTNTFYLDTHPDGNTAIVPFINNDIAFFTEKGGNVVLKFDGNIQPYIDLTACFDGSTSYWRQDISYINEISMELDLHEDFTNRNTIYIDFGQEEWRCKNIKVDVMHSRYDSSWSNITNITDNEHGQYYSDIEYITSGQNYVGFDRIRFTFSGWNASEFRIAQIGLIGWDSTGMRKTYMSRGIDDKVYRNITPGSSESYDLGSEDNKWNNIYGNLKGMADALAILGTNNKAWISYTDENGNPTNIPYIHFYEEEDI